MRHFFVAGFDFGTSYSKVVLRDQLTGVAKVVTFGVGKRGVLPSFVSVASGSLIGPEGEKTKLVIAYPKLVAADAAANRHDFSSLYGDRLAAVHTALGTKSLEQVASFLLIRFFLSALDSIHRFIGSDDEWNKFDPEVDPLVVQLAVPSGLNAADGKTDSLMQRAMAAATFIRRREPKFSAISTASELATALRAVDSFDPATREDLDTRCITYPEVAAGVQTVLRSPNTPDGKYITLDVGAGTVDLNAFYRRSARHHENPGLDYWSCEVRPLGCARLDLGRRGGAESDHEVTVNPLSGADLMKRLQVAVTELMKGAFRYQPNRVHGGGSPWRSGTIAYIWGGGVGHQPYEDTFLHSLQSLGIGVHGINRLPLPSDPLRLPADLDFGRLAVAYGLSFHKANLDAVRLPHQLKTFDELCPDYWQDAIDSKKLCTCRANPTCLRCFGTGFISLEASIAPLAWLPTPGEAALETPQPRRKTRHHIALEKCVRHLHGILSRQRHALLIEQLLLLNRVRLLCARPEFRDGDAVLADARYALLYNVALLGGNVRVRRFSAARTADGCRCLVLLKRDEPPVDIDIRFSDPARLESVVNGDAHSDFVNLGCGIRRSDRGDFFISVSSLNPNAHRPSYR